MSGNEPIRDSLMQAYNAGYLAGIPVNYGMSQPANNCLFNTAGFSMYNPNFSPNRVFGPQFNYSGFNFMGSGGNSGSSTSSTGNSSYQEWLAGKEEEYKANDIKAQQDQDRYKYGYIDIGENGIKLDDTTRRELEEEEIKDIENGNKDSCSLGMNLAFGSVFVAGKINNGLKSQTNSPITQIFFEEHSNAAKFQKLYNSHPTTMIEAQEELAKYRRDYLKQLNRYRNNGSGTKALDNAYNTTVKEMQKALKNGDADEVARLTHKIRTTRSSWWQRLKSKFGGEAPDIITRRKRMKNVNATNVKAKGGNSFLRNCGGRSGFMLSGFMALLSLYSDKEKISAAFEKDAKTGWTQLGQSGLRAASTALTYQFGNALGQTIANKAVAKGAGKIATGLAQNTATKASAWLANKAATKAAGKVVGKVCAKVATKVAGRAIGAAIGSCVPGIGTVIGFVIGCVADWALNKWVFSRADVTDKNNVKQSGDDQLLFSAYVKQREGKEISFRAQNLLAKNPELCQSFEQQIAQAQQQGAA